MTVRFFIGQEPDTQHEHDAVEHFRRGMEAAFGNSKDYYFVLVNYFVGGNQIDLTILKRDAIIIVELKECREPFVATENGDWLTPSGRPIRTGTENPFEQVRRYRMRWEDFLSNRGYRFLSSVNLRSMRFDHTINTLVCISPRLHRDCRNEIAARTSRWFGLVGLDRLAQTVAGLSNPELCLSEAEIRKLIEVLNLPGDRTIIVPRPVVKSLVDREDECSQLVAHLNDKKITVISLRGSGGVGKTELAAWLADKAECEGYQPKWIDCRRKKVTLEALLVAVAGKVQDRERADYIRNPKEKLSDRLDAALDFLDANATLFVFDDYHLIADPKPIEEFLTYLVHHAKKLRVVLTTRTHPACFANLDWPWKAAREVCLEGLPFEAVGEFVGPEVTARLTTDQLFGLWQEADGIPYLMKVLTKVEFTPGKDEDLNQWLQSLLKTLSDEARQLVYNLSVIRPKLNLSLIQALARTDGQQASKLVRELTEQHILREWDEKSTFALHDLARDFLCAQASEKVRCNAHSDAGNYFSGMAEATQEKPERLEYLVEALYHFEQAPNPEKVLQLSGEAHTLLKARGAWDEAQRLAEKALAAARQAQKRDRVCFWLAQIAEGEIDRDTLDVAGTHLKEAEASLPKLGKQPSPEQVAERNGLKMRILIQRGRLAYRIQDYDAASVSFNETLDLARQMGDPLAEADCLIRLGQVQRRRGQYAPAKDHFSQARAIADQEKRKDIAFECVSYLGTVTRKQNRVLEAYRLYEAASQIAREIGDRRKQEESLSYMGQLAAHPQVGNLPKAEEFLRESLAIAQEIHNIRGIRIELSRLIDILIPLRKYQEATELLKESEQLNQQANDRIGMAWDLKHRGQLEQAGGNIQQGDCLIWQGIHKLKNMEIEDAWLDEFVAVLSRPYAVCTYCSRDKSADPGEIPAIHRYKSARIADVHAAARKLGVGFYILSGKFGLIPPAQPIPYYDHLLQVDEVGGVTGLVAEQIKQHGITGLVYFTQSLTQEPNVVPYHDTLAAACSRTGATFCVIEMEQPVDG